jgi:uncharacterized protein (TIGR03437 family)
VNNNGTVSAPVQVPLLAAHPGIFAVDGTAGAILHGDFSLVTEANPAHRGEVIAIYVTGLGPVTFPPATGAPGLDNPLSLTTFPISLTIGGIAATPSFAGLAPTFVGLYQINVEIPPNVPTGTQNIVLVVNGLASKPVSISIQ